MNKKLLDKLAQESGHWSSKGLENFVELIIRECTVLLEQKVFESNIQNQTDYQSGWDAGMLHAIGMLKDFNGIKE